MAGTITKDEVKEMHEAGSNPAIIDVRGPKEYAEGYVAGAVNIPVGELARKLKRIPTDRAIVTYCNMLHPGSSRGERAAEMLRENGLPARALEGGFPHWKEAGLPVEAG